MLSFDDIKSHYVYILVMREKEWERERERERVKCAVIARWLGPRVVVIVSKQAEWCISSGCIPLTNPKGKLAIM